MQYYLLIIIEKATEEIADTQISTGVGQDREPVKWQIQGKVEV